MEDATQDAFKHWYVPGFSHDMKKLQARYFGAGTLGKNGSWAKFKRAIAVYEQSREEGNTEQQALSDAKLNLHSKETFIYINNVSMVWKLNIHILS